MNLRERAARALDATHSKDGRGPKTFLARRRVALALDADKRPKRKDVEWLETIAREPDSPLIPHWGQMGEP